MKAIGSRALEPWPKFFQQICVRQQLILNLLVKRIKFRPEFGVEKYLPRHKDSMYYTTYVVKYIFKRLIVIFSIA
jgi:hypothetical protein